MEPSSTSIAAASKSAKLPCNDLTNPSLPTDIIIDIFSRLPAKSVVQMEGLSKHYSSSLSKDPKFVEAHLRQSSRLRPSLIVKERHSVSLIRSNGGKITVEKVTLPPEIDYPDSHKCFDIVASCNGIVLVVIGPRCSLWNPATGTFLNLPYRPYSYCGPNGEKLHFRKASWGFGYCDQSRDHKIVRIAKYKSQYPYTYTNVIKKIFAEVICVDTNRVWRTVDFSGFEMCNGSGISLNGVAYWQPTQHENNCRILTFDLAKEKFEWISCPKCVEIMVFKGSLAIYSFSLLHNSCTLWIAKDERVVNKDSWMIHSILDFCLHPIGLLNDHQLLVLEFWSQRCGDIDFDFEHFVYDFDTREIKKIHDLSIYQYGEVYYNFADSLVAFCDRAFFEYDSGNYSDGSSHCIDIDE